MPPAPSRRRRGLIATAALASIAVAAAVAVGATAAPGGHPTLRSARAVEVGSHHEPIAVTAHGRAVYDLTPETIRHLLCTRANGCFRFWAPVTVPRAAKLVRGAGVSGHLGTLTRDGFRQLTLNGHPLYTFFEDRGSSEAHGDGVRTFGGTWHVFREGPAAVTPPTSSTSTSTTSSSTTASSSTTSPAPGY
jgi:predicted lipoprotein with Yx(FWY)xxD motif